MTFGQSVEKAIAAIRQAGFSTNQAVLAIHMAVETIGQRIEREDVQRCTLPSNGESEGGVKR